MCGIAGELAWTRPPDREAVGEMVRCLVHRGPDAEGMAVRGPLILGHRRLVVIDPDPASHQPLSDHSGRLWLSFNGEIYNYRELRQELRSRGACFRTASDSEVILEAYKEWGLDCLRQLNGMFAFALWDEGRQRLILARDRLGEKPLYYQPLPEGGLIFASELQALQRHPGASRTIDPRAVSRFLSLNYTLASSPILAGVRKLAPAHFLVVERDRPSSEACYWDLAPHFRDKRRFRDEGEAAEALAQLVDDSVRLRLVSDVPLGAFLSGGIDSSTVVEAMTRLRPPGQNKTFSIGFDEPTFSELPQARAVARHLAVDHHDQVVDAEMATVLPAIVRAADEPFADTSIIPMYFLARFARQQVTVCLSGDGGDEILAGYPTYAADRLHRLCRWTPPWLSAAAGRLLHRVWPVSFDKVSLDYKLRQFLAGLPLPFRRAHHSWRTICSREEKRLLLRPPYRDLAEDDGFAAFDGHFEAVAGCHYLDQAMYVDLKTWLPDDILTKVDRATMAHSLESRAPFLDHRLVELAASLPVAQKLRWLRSKHLLKEVGRQRLPRSVVEQPKRGFNAPVSHWLASTLDGFARAAILDGPVTEWVEPAAAERLWREHQARAADHGLKLFGLTCLALWLGASP